MNSTAKLKEWLRKLKGMKPMETFILVLVVAVALSLLSGLFGQKDEPLDMKAVAQETETVAEAPLNAEDLQEYKLKKALSAINGAGQVEVMITYKSGTELVPAMITARSNTDTQEQDSAGGVRSVAQTDQTTQPYSTNTGQGSEPLIMKEIKPEIQGVIIIAQGAHDLRVRLELQRAVQTVLGIYANQVEVFVMDENMVKE